MERKIKFRGKDIETDKWVDGDLIQRMGYMPSIMFPYESNGKVCYGECAVKRETVGQFTGLLDKNGKEIYEGDIMGLPERDAKGVAYKNRYVRVVEWINDGFFLLDHCVMGGEVRKYGDRLALEISLNSNYAGMVRCFSERGLDYTVIGNIYDNPELLKGGAE